MRNLDRYLFRGIEFSGEWVYGDLRRDGVDTLICEVGGPICHVVLHKSIGQWTGLTDRGGKRVFEGDIVRISNYDGRFKHGEPEIDYRLFNVEWNRYTWAFINDVIYMRLSDYDTNDGTLFDIEITGTIHDHLLRKKCTAE